jgi:hypothetical protein
MVKIVAEFWPYLQSSLADGFKELQKVQKAKFYIIY